MNSPVAIAQFGSEKHDAKDNGQSLHERLAAVSNAKPDPEATS
jgi:hypothetical protein